MATYKMTLQPTLILIQSPDLVRYIQSIESCFEKPLEPIKTSDEDPKKREKEIARDFLLSPIAQQHSQKKYLKDDYQKNITINVVKCCIREMLSKNYQKLLRKRCISWNVDYAQLLKFIEPILKEVVISLGDLKKMLTTGDEVQLRLKGVFGWFLQWYLRHKYMYYLLHEGKMNFKERYIEYKNKYILYLLEMIREERKNITKQETPSQ